MPEFFSPANGLLSPASLFLLLNLVISTIVITSRFTSNRKPQQEEEQDRRPPLVGAPSLLYRVKSFNLSFRKNSPPDSDVTPENGVHHLERSPSLLQRLKSVKFSSLYRSEPESEPEPDFGGGSEIEVPEEEIAGESEAVVVQHHVARSESEQRVAAAEPEKETRMRKSASEKAVTAAAAEEEGERVELRRPQTARFEKTTSFGDEGVDAKADDFINRFKQQLKLQRLESLLRYRNMLNRN